MIANMIAVSVWLFVVGSSTDPGTDFVSLVSKASGPTLMAVIILGAINEWWVPGRTHRRTVTRLDALLDAQLKNTDIQERAVNVAATRLSLSEQIDKLYDEVKRQEGKR